jgi:hypothetical protein
MAFINRTGERVVIYADEPGFPVLHSLEPMGPVIRVQEFTRSSGSRKTFGVPFVTKGYGEIENISTPKTGEIFVVSERVLEEATKRMNHQPGLTRIVFSMAAPDYGYGAVRFDPELGLNRNKGSIVGTTALIISRV